MLDEDLREEFRQDLLEESKKEEWHEMMMQEDYDYFLEYQDEEIEELSNLYYQIKQNHEDYGHNFDFNYILK